MNLVKANFPELYERHLCRHSQFGINVIHILAVAGIYLALYGIVHRLTGLDWLVFAIAGAHLLLVAWSLPFRVLLGMVAFLALFFALFFALTPLDIPVWAYLLSIPVFYKIQAWSHKVYHVEKDMTEFNKKYQKGFGLFVLLSVYELPILLNYLVFDKKNWQLLFQQPRVETSQPQPSGVAER
jgi:hypothetical protein